MIFQRRSGAWEILDLKLAFRSKSIVKDKKRRRRFTDGVVEGIAQLVHYRDYFKYEKNRMFAKEKYGIEIEDPGLVLIIGNDENYKDQYVADAMRMFADQNVVICDYDTFAASAIAM